MPHLSMAQFSALMGSVDRLLILHLLTFRNVSIDEVVRETGRSRRRIEGFLAELVDAGVVVASRHRGRRVYGPASHLVRDLVVSLVALDQATRRQRRHLRLVHSSDAAQTSPRKADYAANGRDLRREPDMPNRTSS